MVVLIFGLSTQGESIFLTLNNILDDCTECYYVSVLLLLNQGFNDFDVCVFNILLHDILQQWFVTDSIYTSLLMDFGKFFLVSNAFNGMMTKNVKGGDCNVLW